MTKQKDTMGTNYIVAVDFTKQGEDQAQIIELSEVEQMVTHLAHSSGSEFYMASKVNYRQGLENKVGLRFVRYDYNAASNTLSIPGGAEKIII